MVAETVLLKIKNEKKGNHQLVFVIGGVPLNYLVMLPSVAST